MAPFSQKLIKTLCVMSQKLEEEDGKRENGLIAEIDPLMSPEKSRMDSYQNHWILHLKRQKDK